MKLVQGAQRHTLGDPHNDHENNKKGKGGKKGEDISDVDFEEVKDDKK